MHEVDVIDHSRYSVRFLTTIRYGIALREELQQYGSELLLPCKVRVTASFPVEERFPPWKLEFKQSSFYRCDQPLRNRLESNWPFSIRFTWMLCSAFPFGPT